APRLRLWRGARPRSFGLRSVRTQWNVRRARFFMRFILVASLALALAACGQSNSGGSGESGGSSPSSPPAFTQAQNQAAIAALPAPYNAANYDAGRLVFAQCRSCHTISNGGANMVGPNLHGVVGRHIGSVQNFNYSPLVKAADFSWDSDHLDRWISN